MKRFVLALLVVVACRDKQAQPTSAGSATRLVTADGSVDDTSSTTVPDASACAATAAALKVWIVAAADPTQEVAAPWPTGDADFDAYLENERATWRDLADPSKPARPLVGEPRPGKLDQEFAECAVAQVRLAEIGNADDKVAAWSALADAIAACDCEPNIPHVKALLYLILRGGD